MTKTGALFALSTHNWDLPDEVCRIHARQKGFGSRRSVRWGAALFGSGRSRVQYFSDLLGREPHISGAGVLELETEDARF